MDSYRPGQSSAERDGDQQRRDRDGGTNRDSRYYTRAPYPERDDRHRNDRSHEPHRQQYGDYQDLDGGRYSGGRRRDSRPYLEYEDEGDDQRHRGSRRFEPSAIVSHADFSVSDSMRFSKDYGPSPNTGEKDKDIDNKPNRYLLIRNLKPSLSDELLAKGLEKLYNGADEHEGGATPLSLRCVLVIQVRGTPESMGYGFAEFHSVEDAKAAREKSKHLGHQCTISSQQFQADFPHTGVFPDASLPGKFGRITPEEFTFVNAAGRRNRYHDERYFARELMINEISPYERNKTEKTSTTRAGNKRGADALESKSTKPKKAKKNANQTALPELHKWQMKQAELRVEPQKPAQSPPTDINAISTISEQPTSDEQTFAIDTEDRKRCFLCGTKFSKSETLMQHLSGEALNHEEFLRDETRRYRGFQRLRKEGIDLDATIKLPARKELSGAATDAAAAQQQQALQWRDRAAERRQEQAAAPPPKVSFSLKPTGSAAQKSRPTSSGSDEARPALSRGWEMLQRAGWSPGQGLGDGSGISAPIEQSLYAARVGLGHEGSKRGDALAEAERMTKDERGDFAEKTKENARQRYERLG